MCHILIIFICNLYNSNRIQEKERKTHLWTRVEITIRIPNLENQVGSKNRKIQQEDQASLGKAGEIHEEESEEEARLRREEGHRGSGSGGEGGDNSYPPPAGGNGWESGRISRTELFQEHEAQQGARMVPVTTYRFNNHSIDNLAHGGKGRRCEIRGRRVNGKYCHGGPCNYC